MTQFRSLIVLALISLTGCSALQLGDNLAYGVLNHDDVELVEAGLPNYLLTLDGFIKTWPENERLLRSGATLYSAYAGQFVDDEQRAARLHERAMDYALRSVCVSNSDYCNVRNMPMSELEAALETARSKQVPALYTLGTVWAGWVQHNRGDWGAVAELARVQAIITRVAAIEPEHEQGQAFMYLGVMDSMLPASLGGQPERAREHFERAIELSNGNNQMARVLYAKHYARLRFDRKLHDCLLTQVIDADPHAQGLTLINEIARREAAQLLSSADSYF